MINGFEVRLSRLEARRNPREPDPRVAAEAYARAMTALLGLASTIEVGEEAAPSFEEILAAIEAIIEDRRRQGRA